MAEGWQSDPIKIRANYRCVSLLENNAGNTIKPEVAPWLAKNVQIYKQDWNQEPNLSLDACNDTLLDYSSIDFLL